MIEFDEQKQNDRVEMLKKVEAEKLTKMLSQKYGLQYIDLTTTAINTDALRVIKLEEAQEAKIAVFDIVGKKVKVGVLSPSVEKTASAVENITAHGYIPTLYLISLQSLEKVWDRYKDLSYSFETAAGLLDVSTADMAEFVKTLTNINIIKAQLEEVVASKKTNRLSRIMGITLAGAIGTKASDVHIEPEEEYVRIRYRLDGVLVEIITFDHATYALLLSRIKLLSGMKVNVRGKAQDGRFSIKTGEQEIEIRCSILPGNYDDSIVMRLLDPRSIAVPLGELGIHPRLLKILLEEINKPNGMLLTTGPTGSGKTTTLYAFMKKVQTPEIKIITIENPVEYHLPGILQTQTDEKKGYTFLSGLRSALRQDPDVIMVGEIRDSETAEIAINAALTGHLVFSTLHTNNSAGAFPRLIDLGANPKVLTSAITFVIAQRLVRKLCKECKQQISLEGAEKTLIDTVVTSIQDKTYLENADMQHVFKAVGCEKCNNTGYKGRIGIYEGIKTDHKIEDAVENNPSEREIIKASQGQNILNMKQDGVLKILQGITSIGEVERVVELTESE